MAEYAQAQAVFSSAAAEQAFLRAQQAVLARQKAEHNETQMKTTLNIVMLDKQSMYWGHVGGFAYILRRKRCIKAAHA